MNEAERVAYDEAWHKGHEAGFALSKTRIEQLERENERLRGLVKASYDEGFNDGCDVELGNCGMPLWEETRASQALKGNK